ncbi:hypothetical protein CKAH01_16966 [Colletotrichum kahawae]|uniref:Uncharacterized protein n=1 Tax=Colletotrichum kahawae TaxID=34407 RepID=A0AAD9YBH7_COLKA|nr:hypothetical protein CKAH01_16966 [Colletotrichum kahawae]
MRRRRRCVTADGHRGGRRFSHRSHMAASHITFSLRNGLWDGWCLFLSCDGLGGSVIPSGWKLCQSLVLVVYRRCLVMLRAGGPRVRLFFVL